MVFADRPRPFERKRLSVTGLGLSMRPLTMLSIAKAVVASDVVTMAVGPGRCMQEQLLRAQLGRNGRR